LNCDGICINDTDSDGVCNEIEVLGCADPTACNYNASATDEDASCTYPTQSYLNCDGTCINDTDSDGVCNEIEVPGCTDPEACNFSAVATDDNESCTYPTLNYLDCEGNCLNDSDLDGICNEEETSGCTDEAACNYNASATDEDGSCVYASLTYYVDGDGDGFGAGDGALYCSDPGAGFTLDNTDCDDSNALISPSAAEVCNEVDDDCDIEVDEFVTSTFYADADGDGFGNATDAIEACEMPDGYVDNQEDCDDNLLTYQDSDGDGMGTNVPDACGSISNEDCDDSNVLVFLGAEEICENGIDEDCDGQDLACAIEGCMDTLACNYNPLAVVDNESCTYPASSSVGCNGLCIEDTDGDGICNPDEIVGCTRQDACNYNPLATDEDDPSCIYPEASYLNCDGTCINDVDSDGVCDEIEVVGCQDETACNYNPLATDNATCEYASLTYYVDADGDGVGTDEPVLLCEVPTSGYADHPGDCDDNNATVYAGAVEICNDVDDDCDGEIDEGVLLTFFADADGDGFGDNNTSVQGCVAPEGYVNNDSDCDDTQITYTDLDGDGYGSEGWVACGSYFNTDCDDSNAGINPLQSDICGNGIDEDCSGSDEVCPLIVASDNTYNLNEDDANVVLDVLSNDQGTATTILPSTLDLDVNTPGVQTTVTTSAGTWVSNGTGQVIFTPNPNYNSELFGDAVLTYQVSDANGVVSNIATVTVEIAPIEDNPIIVEEMIDSITPFQTPVEICLDAQEVDGQDNFIINVFGPNNGVITNLEDTNFCFTYTPNDNFSGVDSIAIIMCDSGSGSLCDTVWVTINVGLGAPIAHNDFATISEDEIANIDLLSNDDAGDLVIDASSVDLDPSTPGIQQSYTSADGLWTVDGNGGLTFTPNPNYNGITMITYTVSDTTGAVSNVAMISIEVLPINDGPQVSEGNGPIVNETNFEEPIVICIDAVDVDGDSLSLSAISGPANGTLNEQTELCFEYVPNAGFTGLDSVAIVVCDNGLPTHCDTVIVYINVLPTAPVAVDDMASMDEDASVIIPILENDVTNGAALDLNTVDLDVNTPGIQNTYTTVEGTWTVDGLGTVTFTPVANFNGNASLNYQVTDVVGNTSNSGLVTVTVNPINDAPNGPISVTESTPFETPATVCIDPSLVIDIDGDQVSVTSVLVDPANGVVSGLNDGDLCFTYVPNNNFTGIDSMLVTICDNGTPSLCDTVWAYVLIGGSAPIAQDDYVNSNTATVSIDVALNDQIPGNVGYTVSVVDSTSNGTIVLNGSLVSYTPDFGFCGVDSMLYSICNDMGMCDTAMLIIDVTPADADLDGISDFYETLEGDADADGTPNYLDEDSDNDGLTDSEEAGTSSLCDANFKDCDQDGTPDYLDFFTCGVALEIPEGFSPNGDNTNDTWVIPGVEEFPENTMTVFNRWGAQVYSKAPYDNSWDGTCSENAIGSNLLPEGTYFFVFKTGPNGETKNGYVYIKR
jgi:gliding motility-associated-like protein